MAQQPGKSRGQIIQSLHEQPCGVETCVVPPAQSSATQQRLRIHIPDPRTTLLLGQRLLGGIPFGYPGVSLQTVENLFADIQKSTVLQSHGSMLLQTGAQWQQFAGKLMELSSREAMRVTSGRVWIGAIGTPTGFLAKRSHGESLRFDETESLTSCVGEIEKIKCIWDKIVAVLGTIYSAVGTSKADNWMQWADFAISTVHTFLTTEWHAKPEEPQKPKPMDVNIYGEEGVNIVSSSQINLATSDSASIFAPKGVTMTSGLPSTIQAALGVKILGGLAASLEAGACATVKAVDRVGISSLRGSVSLQGDKIIIGEDPQPILHLSKQVPTKNVQVKAIDEIDIGSENKIYIKSGDSVSLMLTGEESSAQVVSIQVGSYNIEVKPEGIKIGNGGNGNPSDPLVLINDNNIVIKRGDMRVKVTPKRVQLGFPPNGHFTIKNGNATVKGKRIQLG